MLKKNLSPNAMKLPKMKPVLFQETTDEFTPASSQNHTETDSAGKNSRGTSITRPHVGAQSWDGGLPTNINEQFQMYLANNYLQDNESKVENRTVFDDIFKSRNTPAVLEVAERLKQTAGKVVAPVKTPTNSLGSLPVQRMVSKLT